MGAAIPHLVLLGDSTLDNGFYVGKGNPAIVSQLQLRAQERGWKASSVAVDGHSVSHIPNQLTRIPADATHLFISIGGNDALSYMQRLNTPVNNLGEGLRVFTEIAQEFTEQYATMLTHVSERKIPITVCTMYKPNFENPEQRRMCEPALAALNHGIVTEATKLGIPVIDLTTVFNDLTDYANAIEPAAEGGAKIVENILCVMDNHNFEKKICAIYAKTNK